MRRTENWNYTSGYYPMVQPNPSPSLSSLPPPPPPLSLSHLSISNTMCPRVPPCTPVCPRVPPQALTMSAGCQFVVPVGCVVDYYTNGYKITPGAICGALLLVTGYIGLTVLRSGQHAAAAAAAVTAGEADRIAERGGEGDSVGAGAAQADYGSGDEDQAPGLV
jgi:hypothetical protein